LSSSKEELSRALSALVDEHLAKQPEAVTRYVASRPPDRKPWRKRPSLLDEAFSAELEKAEKNRATQSPP